MSSSIDEINKRMLAFNKAMLNEFVSLPSTCVFSYGACDSFELENYAKSLNLPVLNLKTGEVTGGDYIKPQQLICDEAREVLKDCIENVKPMVINIESELQFNELLKIVPKPLNAGIKYDQLEKHIYVLHYSENMPKLNLSTGEVTPVIDALPLSDELIKKIKDVSDEKIEHCKKCSYTDELENSLSDARGELKEKDRVLENMNTLLKAHVKELKEKDKEIQLRDTFLANYKSQLDKSEAKLKDKDAENEQLKKANDIINHSHSVIIQERDQWKDMVIKTNL